MNLEELKFDELQEVNGGVDWNSIGMSLAAGGGGAIGAKIGASAGFLGGGPVGSAAGGIIGGAVGTAVYTLWD